MAHRQYPRHHGAAELDTSNRSQLDGQIFEMPGEPIEPRTEQSRRPVQAQDGDAMQANPWPFYLDQDVKTESRADVEESAARTGAGNADAKAEQPLANPWPYFGPSEDEDGPKAVVATVGLDVGGLGIRTEEPGDAKAKSEDVSTAAAPAALAPLHHGSQGERGGDRASPPPASSEPSPPLPPSFYPAPLRVSRKQLPPAAAPVFKPYLPPTESVTAVAPLQVKRHRPSDGSQGDPAATLPYRPYRPAGHDASNASDAADAAASSPPAMPPQPASPPLQAHRPPATAVAPQGTSSQATTWAVSASPNLAQQQQHRPAVDSPGSAEAPLDGVAPHHQHHQPNRPPSPTATGPPPPAAAPFVPPSTAPAPAPPIQEPVPKVAVAEHPTIAGSTPYHNSQHPTPPIPAGSPYHPSASPSHPSPATGYPPNSSPVPGHQAYGPPHSTPGSSIPSPEMASFQFQPITQAQPQNLYTAPTPTPPIAAQPPPAPVSYPPPQHFTPPPPTSSYDIPQRTYASSAEIPPPQPPRPQFQQAAMGAYQPQPQPSPQSPQPPYVYDGAPRPVTQPPSSTQPSSYNLPYGPAIAPHQHQYPTQPTYAAPNGNVPSSPDPQGQYASPPLPPRPATTQPQLFAGFTSQNAVAYPPPPKRVFSPPPTVAAPPPPRRPSGGSSSGRLFSSSSALKWIDKRGKGLENKLDAVLQGSQRSSNQPPPQPPRPT